MIVWEALDALSHELELCAIDAETKVVVLSPADPVPGLRELVRVAVSRTGASAVEIRPISDEPARLVDNALLASGLERADVLIACTPLRDPESLLRQMPRLRILSLGAAAERPQDHPPHTNMRRRIDAVSDLLTTSAAVSLADELGTALRIELHDGAVHGDDGICTEAGTAASFPSGWVGIVPADGSVQGDLVLGPGDANLTARALISSPTRLCIRNDHITAIEGDHPDADVMRAQLERARDQHAYGFAGVTFGMNPGRAHGAAPFDAVLTDPELARLTSGVVTVTFGANAIAGRACDHELSLALSERTAVVDDLVLLRAGRLQGQYAPDVYESPG